MSTLIAPPADAPKCAECKGYGTIGHKLLPCFECKGTGRTAQRAQASQAEHIKTWRERMPAPRTEFRCDANCYPSTPGPDCMDCVPVTVRGDAVAARDEEIADLRAALARLISPASYDVLAERRRQVEQEGWTPEHDDEHGAGEMAEAAACYITGSWKWSVRDPHQRWPWAHGWWKPKDRRSNLVRAGALILAEIERIDRAAIVNAQKGGAA